MWTAHTNLYTLDSLQPGSQLQSQISGLHHQQLHQSDFPVPDLIHCLMGFLPIVHVMESLRLYTHIIQILAVWHVFVALQIVCFHAIFIFIGIIAQPLHTALTMIFFYTAIMFSLTTTFTLLYASFHVRHSERWAGGYFVKILSQARSKYLIHYYLLRLYFPSYYCVCKRQSLVDWIYQLSLAQHADCYSGIRGNWGSSTNFCEQSCTSGT